MSREGKLSFRVVQWDEQLLQAAGKVPAGPLFDIKCPEDAVSQLHLPHCETTPGEYGQCGDLNTQTSNVELKGRWH